jgi:ribosomal protein S18 acetylase RimI-like enzyme
LSEDVDLIAALGARTFAESFGADNRPEDMTRYIASNFSTLQIERELVDAASIFLLLFEDGQPVGYAKLGHSKPPDCVTGPKPLELVRIYVEQQVIGLGFGSTLMRACLEESGRAGYRTIWLGVWEHNKRAIKFYEKWGFAKVGTRAFVLGDDVQTDFVLARPVKLVV